MIFRVSASCGPTRLAPAVFTSASAFGMFAFERVLSLIRSDIGSVWWKEALQLKPIRYDFCDEAGNVLVSYDVTYSFSRNCISLECLT